MKKAFLLFVIASLVAFNFIYSISSSKTDGVRIGDVFKIANAQAEDPIVNNIYTKDFCNCFRGGDDSDFGNFCGATWECVDGNDLESCTDHPGCSSGCSCV